MKNEKNRIFKFITLLFQSIIVIQISESSSSILSVQNRLSSMFFEEDNSMKAIEISFESRSIPTEFYNKGRKVDIFTSNSNINATNSFKDEELVVRYVSNDKKIFLPKIIKNIGLIDTFDPSKSLEAEKRMTNYGANIGKGNDKNNYFEKEIQYYYSTEIQGKTQYYFPHVNNYKLECSIPFKKEIFDKKENNKFHYDSSLNFTQNLSEKNAFLLMKNIAYLCSSSDIREWFFKVCPFASAHQQLKNLKILPNGTSYVEYFNLGTKEGYLEELKEASFKNETYIDESINSENTSNINSIENKGTDSSKKNLFEIDQQEIKRYEKLENMENMQIKNLDNNYNNDFDINESILNLDNSKNSGDKVLFAKKAYMDANLNSYFNEEINKIAEKYEIVIADDSLAKQSFLYCDGRVCKLLNDFNFNKYRDYDCEFILEYKGSDLKYFLDKNEEVFYHETNDQEAEAKRIIQMNNLDEWMYNYLFSVNEIADKKYMDNIEKYSNTKIKINRKIMRFVTDNTFAINKAFPNKQKIIYTNDFTYTCKDKKPATNTQNFLSVNKELAYCSKCDFIHQVQNGDFLVLVRFLK